MGFKNRFVRSRLGALGAAGATAVLAVVMSAAPAWAHNTHVSGVTSCPASDHVITWTIHNVESLPTRPMTIESVTATINGTTYPVTGYDKVVPPLGNTEGTTVVPGNVSGRIFIKVDAVWPDGFHGSASNWVDLVAPCPMPTTTTAAPPTSSSTPSNTSTGSTPPPTGGTPSSGPGVTVQSTPASPPLPPGSGVAAIEAGPTTAAAPGSSSSSLPFTGSASTVWAIIGIAAFAAGVMLVKGSKRGAVDER